MKQIDKNVKEYLKIPIMKHSTSIFQEKQIYGDHSFINEEIDFVPWFLDYMHARAKRDGKYPMHTHFCHEIITPTKGEYHCWLNGRKLSLNPGDFILIQPGQRHEDICTTGIEFQSIHFVMHPLDGKPPLGSIFRTEISPEQQIIHSLPTWIWEDFKFQMGRADSNSPNSFRMHNAVFNVFLRRFLQLYPSGSLQWPFSQESNDGDMKERLQMVFANHLEDMPTLAEICKEAQLGRSTLHRVCQELLNMPPHKAFMNFKMRKVLQFMHDHPTCQLKLVAESFGFKNQFHFSRAFRKENGFCPAFLSRRRKAKPSSQENE